MVIVNHTKHTGIVIKELRKHVRVVFMSAGGLKISSITKQDLADNWKQLDYDEKKAAELYLRHGLGLYGITEDAKEALYNILNG